MMALLPLEEAKARLLEHVEPISQRETVALCDANGRVLAADLVARLTQPPFVASAMDGYALRASDATRVGTELSVIGTAAAGHPFAGSVGVGEAVRIFTGAPVPQNADTVIMQEDVLADGDQRISMKIAAVKGRHVRPLGQDFTDGETVLAADTCLDFSHLTVAAAMNHPLLTVYRRPKVALLATGDELRLPGDSPSNGQIIASNPYGISALIKDNGGEVLDLGIVPDRRERIAEAVDTARRQGADVLVTLGGASVGDHDLVQATLKGVGMKLDFWRIAMRPGKPLMVGAFDDMQVLGLPGNPVASLVCGLLFLEPLLRRLARLPERKRGSQAITAADIAANNHRQDFLRARLSRDQEGNLVAQAHQKQDSSMMKVFATSDALIIRKPHAPLLPAGAPCPILLLRPLSI